MSQKDQPKPVVDEEPLVMSYDAPCDLPGDIFIHLAVIGDISLSQRDWNLRFSLFGLDAEAKRDEFLANYPARLVDDAIVSSKLTLLDYLWDLDIREELIFQYFFELTLTDEADIVRWQTGIAEAIQAGEITIDLNRVTYTQFCGKSAFTMQLIRDILDGMRANRSNNIPNT